MASFSTVNLLGGMKFMMVIAATAILLAGCRKTDQATEKGDVYQTRGIVRGFSPNHDEVEIQHETIPNYMPSMTMPFRPRADGDIAGLKLGDAVAFRLTVTAKDFWIDQV